MVAFAYRAANEAGNVVTGVIEEESEAVALRALEQQALTPLTLRRAKNARDAAADKGETTRIRLRQRQLLDFTRQLRVMLNSGITLLSALSLLRQTSHDPKYRALMERIAGDIQSGATLSEALAAHPNTFDDFYIGTVRAGEAGGVHLQAMDELIKHYERRTEMRREVIGALTYPAIVVCALVVASIVMLTFVVPQFKGLFAGMGADLPAPTRVLLTVSDMIREHSLLLGGGVVAIIVTIVAVLRTPRGRATFGYMVAHIPLLGRVVYLSTVVQFCRMVALLEAAGLPLLETFKIVENALFPGRVRKLTGEIRRQVGGGSTIASAVADTNVLPKLVEHMISVGEATGDIDQMLNAAGDHLEEQMRLRIKSLTTALEPVLVLVISAMVLGMALAIFLPIWDMNSVMLNK